MAEVIWTAPALEDLEAICSYIARDSPRRADLLAQRVFQATDRLTLFPRSGRVVPELGCDDVREIIFESYRIVYQIVEERVEIVAHNAGLLNMIRGLCHCHHLE